MSVMKQHMNYYISFTEGGGGGGLFFFGKLMLLLTYEMLIYVFLSYHSSKFDLNGNIMFNMIIPSWLSTV